MRLFLILCLVVVAKLEPKSSFKNYKLYEVIPSTHEQVEFLKDMDKKYKDVRKFYFYSLNLRYFSFLIFGRLIFGNIQDMLTKLFTC